MKKLDILYEAFQNYREITRQENILKSERSDFIKLNYDDDIFTVKKFKCIIDETWIQEIEDNLIYIEKAIAEERQFIRTNSEVVPIEKVKKISRESVVHLARHSDYITRSFDKTENIIPDKILMVEKLSDYAVYENRFLYMLLIFIRDFIEYRLSKIKKLRSSYESNFYLNKKFKNNNHEYNFELKFYDYQSNNQYPLKDELLDSLIKRLEDLLEIVDSHLKKQIMIDVSKTPVIKPPIVKTNVLKNNNNFKHALALYEYLASYTNLGYEIEEITKNLTPFNNNVGDSLGEIYSLTNFLCYAYGNDILDVLKASYKERLKEKELIEQEKLLNQIQRLKKQIELEGKEPFEYMLALEKRMAFLTKNLENFEELKREKVIWLNEKKNYLDSIDTLNNKVEELNNKIITLNLEHQNEIENLNLEHESTLNEMTDKFNLEIEDINNNYLSEINDLNSKYSMEIESLNEENANLLKDNDYLKNNYDKFETEVLDKYKAKETELMANIDLEKEKILNSQNKLEELYQKQKDKEDLFEAERTAILIQNNRLTGDYTSKEKFDELERDFLAFTKFFKENYKLTKKEIRKQILWLDKKTKNIK